MRETGYFLLPEWFQIDTLAEIAFERFHSAQGSRDRWREQPEAIQQAWRAVAAAMVRRFEKAISIESSMR